MAVLLHHLNQIATSHTLVPAFDVYRSVFKIVVVSNTLLDSVFTPLIEVRASVD